jgi:hypothetical protein
MSVTCVFKGKYKTWKMQVNGASINKECNSTPILLQQGMDSCDDNENEPVNYKEIRERKRDERGTGGESLPSLFLPSLEVTLLDQARDLGEIKR